MSDRQPTVIVGLDGATFDIIDKLMPDGRLPNMQKIVSQGAQSTLLSSTPPLSAIAWTTITTGVNPGKHGIFDFAHRKRENYEFVPHTARDKKAPSLWRLLGDAGKKSCIVNVPLTYPAERLNGVMVSGFPFPPGARDNTFPSELWDELRRELGDFEFAKPAGLIKDGQEKELVDEIEEKTENQLRVLEYLVKRDRFDFVMTVFDGIDVVSHSLWKFIDPHHPKYDEATSKAGAEQFYRAYEICDRAVGRVRDMVGPDANFIALSDHGNGPVYYGVYVNNWLADRGYLNFKRGARTKVKVWMFRRGLNVYNIFKIAYRLGILPGFEEAYSSRSFALGLVKRLALSFDDIDWERTRVYSFGNYGQLFVNLKGREPKGIVEPGAEYDVLLDELKAGIEELRDDKGDKKIFDQVCRGTDVYSGPCEGDGPDILFFDKSMNYTPHRIFELATSKLVTEHPLYSGNHKLEGVLAADGPSVRRVASRSSASIEDIAPTVLSLLGVGAGGNIDGKALAALFEIPESVAVRKAEPKKGKATEETFTEKESSELTQRLKDLGYM